LPFKGTFATVDSFRDIFSGSSALQTISFSKYLSTARNQPTYLLRGGEINSKRKKMKETNMEQKRERMETRKQQCT
jgi:hypothetical protein